ncbi:hypothetical protein Tco_0231326 [Tanacetum coccineum]
MSMKMLAFVKPNGITLELISGHVLRVDYLTLAFDQTNSSSSGSWVSVLIVAGYCSMIDDMTTSRKKPIHFFLTKPNLVLPWYVGTSADKFIWSEVQALRELSHAFTTFEYSKHCRAGGYSMVRYLLDQDFQKVPVTDRFVPPSTQWRKAITVVSLPPVLVS